MFFELCFFIIIHYAAPYWEAIDFIRFLRFFSQFLDQVGAGKVSEVVLDGETIHVREADGT